MAGMVDGGSHARVPQIGLVPQGNELEAVPLDEGPVLGAGRDGRLVPGPLDRGGHRDRRPEVAQGPQRREQVSRHGSPRIRPDHTQPRRGGQPGAEGGRGCVPCSLACRESVAG